MAPAFSFLEFFAGGGMTRLGLGANWRCALANDIDSQKCAAYRANFGGEELIEGDIASIDPSHLPDGRVDLMWGSFPCQDLSLAGARGGIRAKRSGAFFSFWRLAEDLAAARRAPRIIAVENVAGLLTSNAGRDFAAIVALMTGAGYRVSAMVLDARLFTPQSRPRLFVVAFSPDVDPVAASRPPGDATAPASLLNAVERLPRKARAHWIWLAPTPKMQRNTRLCDILDWDAPAWHAPDQTQALIDMMSEPQRQRIDALKRNRVRRAGAAFRRTRIENGQTVQRVEARFDGIAGCLRTPAGGSSRQIVFALENASVRSRLLTPREAARLMGLGDEYVLPQGAAAALKLCGDGVCVPVVRWLAEKIFEPALARTVRCAAKSAA